MATTIIPMSPKELDRVQTLTKLVEQRINNHTAAKLIGVSIRHIKRMRKRFQTGGAADLIHRLRGRPSHHRLPETVVTQARTLLQQHYFDFKPTLAMEKLNEHHGLILSKETVRQLMIDLGLWIPKQERLKAHYRSWRDRKAQYGEMQQYDGSHHDWFEERLPPCVLLAAIDDATGCLMHARLALDEGIVATFAFWQEYLKLHGKPQSIYLDRYSTYKQHITSAHDDPAHSTQFQRAMERDLGITLIHARSPEAKGRVERLFQTLQDRLVKELRLAQISTLEEANGFLREHFIPAFNQKFAVPARLPGNLHQPVSERELRDCSSIFAIQTPRTVNNDFTLSFQGQWYQLLPQQPTLVLKRDTVMVEEHLDGSICIRKNRHALHYQPLPARPKRSKNLPITGLTPTVQFSWKPPHDHPWRKNMMLKSVASVSNPIIDH